MSYNQYLNEVAEEYKVTKSTWREMNSMMMGIAIMSHQLEDEQIVEILLLKGWKKEELDFFQQKGINMKFVIQDVMFTELCEDHEIPEKYCYDYLDFWNNLK